MSYLSQQFTLFFSVMLVCFYSIEAHQGKIKVANPSIYVSDESWTLVSDYLIPNDHPAKKKLDTIFSRSRAIFDEAAMFAAGFDASPPQHHTHMIVAKHPELKGYVIKAYLDVQDYFEDKPEEHYWIKRIIGVQYIRKSIDNHDYNYLFKVPQKWIYLLPDNPSPPRKSLRKNFILVAEDMELFDKAINDRLWGSERVNEDLLFALYQITTDVGLLDSAKPDNCAFSFDGKVAFVDTELYHKRKVKYSKLTPYLSPAMQSYWKKLTKNEEKRSRLK